MAGTVSAVGDNEKILFARGLLKPTPATSPYLSLCPRQPKIRACISRFGSGGTSSLVDRYFKNYCLDYPPPCDFNVQDSSTYPYQHSIISVEAYQKAIAKRFPVRNPCYVQSYYDLSADWMRQHFYPFLMGARVLTHDEYAGLVEPSTSPGPIWKQEWKDKGAVYGSRQGVGMLLDYWDALPSFGAPRTYFSGCEKDEIRPIEKVRQKKTRIFTAMGVDGAYAAGRLFSDINEKMYQAHRYTFSAVGMTKFKQGFDRMFGYLDKFPNKEALDYGNYDASMLAEIMWDDCRFQFSCLEKRFQTLDNRLRMINVYRDLIQSAIILPDGCVVFEDGGNPSGWPCTSTINTRVNFRLLVYTWLDNGGPDDYFLFMANVCAKLYGDDNTYSYSDYAGQFICGEKVRLSAAKFCMEVTGVGVKSWDTIDFLSHRFVYKDNMYLPALDRNKIVCSMLLGNGTTPLKSLERVAALRIEAYPYSDLFEYLSLYMAYLYSTFQELQPYRSYYLDESLIRKLYTGYESSCICKEQSGQNYKDFVYQWQRREHDVINGDERIEEHWQLLEMLNCNCKISVQ